MTDESVENIISEIGDLGETISAAITKLAEKENYDKEGMKSIQDMLIQLVSAISNFKQIDLKPIINIASDISKQNASIMDMVGRLIHNHDNSQMIKLVTDMVKRNNEFTAQVFKQVDYSDALKSIANNLKKEKSLIESFSIKRENNLIDKVIVNYKNIASGR